MAGTYRAVVCSRLGPPHTLSVENLPRPDLRAGCVRVAIVAAGINFPDYLTVQGLYQHRPTLPFVPGVEAAGRIIEAAPDVGREELGRSVIVRMRTGGYAEEAVVPLADTLHLPAGFSFAEGATLLVAHTTAYHALETRAGLKAGQTLLVLGAAGGVGLAAVQIGKLTGARVLAAASTAHKRDMAARMGAEAPVDYTAQPIEEAVRALTDGRGVDVVFDPVGIAQESALRCLAFGGRLLIAGFAGGSIPHYAANRILLKGCAVVGVRAGEAGRNDPHMRRRETASLMALADRGQIRPLVSAQFPLQSFAEAMQLLGDRRAIGRVALTM
ncbi:MAG TPA: NADPH:quinone oxidoreductase family protein [Hyphomicrobiaceae bacterium]|nr:NADPH:quinone oxidoreductase family protein [Hyphomicrobiaceae bacterium]